MEKEKATIFLQAQCRAFLVQTKWKQLRSRLKRRGQIAEEIRVTEQNYVNHLSFVVEKYMNPLRNEAKGIISPDDFKIIFSDIEIIMNFNKLFYTKLAERMKTWTPTTTKLGDIFVTIADFLKVYTRYINNYTDAHWKVKELVASTPEFEVFLQERRRMSSGQLDLDDYLITPVQRIPRYNLLLSDLVKSTWEWHCDFANLVKAKDKILEIANFFNEQKRKVDNLKKVGDVVSMLSGWDDKQKLLSPTRRFIREGEVTEILVNMQVVEQPNGNSSGSGNNTAHSSLVIGNTEKKSKTYWMLLFNDLVVWTKNKKKFYKFKRMYYLSGVNLSLGNYEGKIGVAMTVTSSTNIPSANGGSSSPVTVKQTVVVIPQPESIAVTEEWLNDFINCRAESLERDEFSVVTKRKTFVHDELIKTVQSIAISSASGDKNQAKKGTITGSLRKKLTKRDLSENSDQSDLLQSQPQSSQNQGNKNFLNTLKRGFREKVKLEESSSPNNTSPTSSISIPNPTPNNSNNNNNVNSVQNTKHIADELKNVLLNKSMHKLTPNPQPNPQSNSHHVNNHPVNPSHSQDHSHPPPNNSHVASKHSSPAQKQQPITQNAPSKLSTSTSQIQSTNANANANANANNQGRNRSISNPTSPEQSKSFVKSAQPPSQNVRPPVPSKPLPPPPGQTNQQMISSDESQNVSNEKEKPPIPPKPPRPLRPTTPNNDTSSSHVENNGNPIGTVTSPNIRPRANTVQPKK